jgi:hypothetical protein
MLDTHTKKEYCNMSMLMWKGKVSKVVDNKVVSSHKKDGWTFSKPSIIKNVRRRPTKVDTDTTVVKLKARLGQSSPGLSITKETNNGD